MEGSPGMSVSDVVDLDRYPVDAPNDSAYGRTVEHVRAQLAATGCALLKDFVTPTGLERMVRESDGLRADAYVSTRPFSPYPPYAPESGRDLPDGHPRRFVSDRTNRFLAYDQFADASPVRLLYEWDCFRDFIRQCLDIPVIHPYGDPLGACALSFQEPGEELPWHFDETHFIVSLLVVEPNQGGSFQYVPNLRGEADENYPAVSAILAGGVIGVIDLDLRPGYLQIFEGRRTLHRVTAPRGEGHRCIALLSYCKAPGVIADESLQRDLFGRIRRPDQPPSGSLSVA